MPLMTARVVAAQFIAHSATVREMKCAMNRAATVCATG